MIGKTLDNKYRIISDLGEIGMGGTVYLAEHTRGIGKKFAIESLSFTLGLDSHIRERFCREATNQALLDHPNIVQTTDYFEEDGQLFLVMEYVDCQDLRKLIKARVKLKEKDALSILGDVLRGLEYAHTKGVIHGCILPSNIIIDKSGVARIKNFGIVSLVVEGLTEARAFGSPRYMSPEQIQRPGQLDLRTDIYSSGIVLYEMLTGEVPFDGETDFSVHYQQIHAPPPNLHLKNPEISEKLTEIVLKAMAKNRAERFQNCTEFLQRLPEQQRQRSEEEARRKTDEQSRKLTTSDHVFICYAREDQAFVLQLGENLKGRGVPVWLDQWDIPPGGDWDRSIDNAIYDCGKFIIVLSSQAVESSEVRGELRTALDENKRIVPVIHSPCRIPRQLRTIQYVDFTSHSADDEAATRQLLRTLATNVTSGVAQQVEITDRERSNPERAPEEAESKLKPGKIFRDKLKDGSQGPEMVIIPAGTFRMGDIKRVGHESERPIHTVRIPKPFAIGRYEVIFEEYDRFAAATDRELPGDKGWGRGHQPAINVSWEDAVEYAKWLSGQMGKQYRLPTEAEWEYAARAGTETEYWWGNEMKSGMANCNEGDTRWGGKQTSPVGSFQPNPFGLYDTAGNVLEWVEDCWHENYEGAPTDGSAWLKGNGGNCGQRVIRGGSWYNRPEYLRASFRYWGDADNRDSDIGFRLAQDID